jgi:hypothetical protein
MMTEGRYNNVAAVQRHLAAAAAHRMGRELPVISLPLCLPPEHPGTQAAGGGETPCALAARGMVHHSTAHRSTALITTARRSAALGYVSAPAHSLSEGMHACSPLQAQARTQPGRQRWTSTCEPGWGTAGRALTSC